MTEILRLRPDDVIREIHAGSIEVISKPKTPTPETPRIEPPRPAGVEKAKRLFGENFLGEDAIHVMENKFRAVGVSVQFEIPRTGFPYSDADIEKAQQDEGNDRGRLVVLRPEWMTVKEGNKDVRKPINILNLRALLMSKNPFGSGVIFYNQDWYNDQDFAKQPLKPGYAMPTREVLPSSRSIDWNTQQALLEPGERRREANEAVWDMLLYYGATGKKILENDYDWTQTRTSDGGLVRVGRFDSDGLCLVGFPRARVAFWGCALPGSF